LKRRAGAKRRPVGTGPIPHDAHEGRSEGKGELIDADHEANERAELLTRPLDGKDETGQS
jgi:hypothetical protein